MKYTVALEKRMCALLKGGASIPSLEAVRADDYVDIAEIVCKHCWGTFVLCFMKVVSRKAFILWILDEVYVVRCVCGGGGLWMGFYVI